MSKRYYSKILSSVSNHILNPGRMAEGEELYYQGQRKGFIIADDDSGELLRFVKESLRYNDLVRADKVCEITIDDTWDDALKKKGQMSGRENWNRLVAAAFKANGSLLVIHITNIKVFSHCWKLKQLAKQENDLEAWFPESSSDITPVDCEFINERIPEKFLFDGNVLLVIEGIGWDRVKKYANEHDPDEFDAMMQFYSRIDMED